MARPCLRERIIVSETGLDVEHMPIPATALGLPDTRRDEIIAILYRMIAVPIDAAWGLDPVQLSLSDPGISAGRTQEEHGIFPPMISYIDVSEIADTFGEEGQDSNES